MTLTVKHQQVVDAAYLFALEAHDGQKRADGSDYFESHVVPIFRILSCVTDDHEVLAAALLHDVVEDTQVTIDDVREKFGNRIASLVWEVTKTYTDTFPNLKSRQGILIKFADRLHNLSDMDGWTAQKRQEYLENSRFWKLK